MRGVVVAGLLAFARPAAADDATRAPGFVTLPRFDRTTRLGFEVDDVLLRQTRDNYARFVFDVQYVFACGFGAYVRWQHYVAGPDLDRPPHRDQAGLIYAVPGSALDVPDMRLVVHAGVGGGPPLPFEMPPHDLVVDAGASILARVDAAYARIDVELGMSRLSIVDGAIDAGVGYGLGDVAVGIEAAWAGYEQRDVTGAPLPTAKELLAAVSARYTGSELQPYIAVMSTFDAMVVGGVVGIEDRR